MFSLTFITAMVLVSFIMKTTRCWQLAIEGSNNDILIDAVLELSKQPGSFLVSTRNIQQNQNIHMYDHIENTKYTKWEVSIEGEYPYAVDILSAKEETDAAIVLGNFGRDTNNEISEDSSLYFTSSNGAKESLNWPSSRVAGYIAKLSNNGIILWAVKIRCSDISRITCGCVTSGVKQPTSYFVAGEFYNDSKFNGFIKKISPTGNELMSLTIDGGPVNQISYTADSDIIVLGRISSSSATATLPNKRAPINIKKDNSKSVYFLARYHSSDIANSDLKWAVKFSFGNSEYSSVMGFTVDHNENIIVSFKKFAPESLVLSDILASDNSPFHTFTFPDNLKCTAVVKLHGDQVIGNLLTAKSPSIQYIGMRKLSDDYFILFGNRSVEIYSSDKWEHVFSYMIEGYGSVIKTVSIGNEGSILIEGSSYSSSVTLIDSTDSKVIEIIQYSETDSAKKKGFIFSVIFPQYSVAAKTSYLDQTKIVSNSPRSTGTTRMESSPDSIAAMKSSREILILILLSSLLILVIMIVVVSKCLGVKAIRRSIGSKSHHITDNCSTITLQPQSSSITNINSDTTPSRVSKISTKTNSSSETWFNSVRSKMTQISFAPSEKTIMEKEGLCIPAYLLFNHDTDFEIVKFIDQGSFGDVLIGTAKNNDLAAFGKRIIIKRFKFNSSARNGKRREWAFYQELSIMYLLRDHKNIATVLGFTEYPFTIILKYYRKGNLFDYILAPTALKSKRIMVQFTKDISEGLEFMHGKGIAHCDLKLLNIFLDITATAPPAATTTNGTTTADEGRLVCVLGDFGLSRVVNDESLNVLDFKPITVAGGSVQYVSPEYVSRKLKKEGEYPFVYDPFESDIYSISIIIYEIVSRKLSWYGELKNN